MQQILRSGEPKAHFQLSTSASNCSR